jgi:hypothetical protein
MDILTQFFPGVLGRTAAGIRRLPQGTDSWNRLAAAIASALAQQPGGV